MYLIEPLSDNTEGDHAFYKQEYLRKKRSVYGDSGITVYDKEPRKAALFKRSSSVCVSKITPAITWIALCAKMLQCYHNVYSFSSSHFPQMKTVFRTQRYVELFLVVDNTEVRILFTCKGPFIPFFLWNEQVTTDDLYLSCSTEDSSQMMRWYGQGCWKP